tara:strand:- start:422 stop:967 length:546 start_codon:yes stop_codon:yes gene_type:complete
MKGKRATIRYAKALLQISIEKDSLEQSYDDMLLVNNVCDDCKDFSLLLKSPIVKTDLKLKILNEIFDNKISEISRNFISIIANKKRESLLSDIAKSFIELYKSYNNIESATITTAVPLSDELKNNIIDYIKKYNNSKIDLHEIEDEKIIGGAIIKIGDKQLDASVSKEISELKQIFNKNLY